MGENPLNVNLSEEGKLWERIREYEDQLTKLHMELAILKNTPSLQCHECGHNFRIPPPTNKGERPRVLGGWCPECNAQVRSAYAVLQSEKILERKLKTARETIRALTSASRDPLFIHLSRLEIERNEAVEMCKKYALRDAEKEFPAFAEIRRLKVDKDKIVVLLAGAVHRMQGTLVEDRFSTEEFLKKCEKVLSCEE